LPASPPAQEPREGESRNAKMDCRSSPIYCSARCAAAVAQLLAPDTSTTAYHDHRTRNLSSDARRGSEPRPRLRFGEHEPLGPLVRASRSCC
jgi:hypothetical protein